MKDDKNPEVTGQETNPKANKEPTDEHEAKNIIFHRRLIEGDAGARNEMIVGNMALVSATVTKVLSNWEEYQYLRDDLRSIGAMALTEAVDTLMNPTVEIRVSIRDFLITCIRNAVSDVLEKEAGMDFSEKRKVGRPQVVGTLDFGRLPDELLASDDRSLLVLENREHLFSLCRSERDRQILELCLEGRKMTEIANFLSVSIDTIRWAMRRMKRRANQEF